MCKEMLVILVNKVVDPKRIIGKNGSPRRRRNSTRGRRPKKYIILCKQLPFTSYYFGVLFAPANPSKILKNILEPCM
jgi:hypothetical protein